jgi:hypothetical protein
MMKVLASRQQAAAVVPGPYWPRATQVTDVVAPYQRRLTLCLFVIAPILGLLLRFGTGSQRFELTVCKAFVDLVLFVFTMIALPSLPDRISRMRHGWIVPVGLIAILGDLAVKAAGVDWLRDEFFWEPFGMEIKPAWYLFAAVAIYLRLGRLELRHWIGRIEFFSVLMILSFFLQIAQGQGTMSRASAVEEANYDGFNVGLAMLMCCWFGKEIKLRTWAVFVIASMLTLSRTGLAGMALLAAVILIRQRHYVWLMISVALLVPALYGIYELRAHGVHADQFDRLRMWQSFFMTLRDWNLFQWVFGMMPGVPIRYYDPYIQWFIDVQSVGQHGIGGLHPFNYHSMHVRFIITWGLLGAFTVLGGIIAATFRSGWLFLLLMLYVGVQGMSMGVIYLTTCAVPAFLVAFEFFQIGRDGPAVASAPRSAA